MRPVAPKAVFLSYASQDGEVARRIAESLRSAGVDVWFDQNELRGGDAWDERIKRQIKECALFIPVISAHTQARAEGYFRREWKIAVDRTQNMAEDVAFLVPVVVDDTSEAEARVPEKFCAAHWTRLPAGETPPTFCACVQSLLTGEKERSGPAIFINANTPTARRPWSRLRPAAIGLAAAALVVLIGWQAWRGLDRSASDTAVRRAPAASKESEVQGNVIQVQKILTEYARGTLARQALELGDQLIQRALQVEPGNAEAWALASQVSQALYAQNYDRTRARRDAIDTQAANAVKLAPDLPEAQFARGTALALEPSTLPDAERLLRGLSEQSSNDWRYRSTLATVLKMARKDAEARTHLEKASQLAGADPVALLFTSDALVMQGLRAEAEQVLDRFLARHPTEAGYLRKLQLLLERDDVAAMQRVLSAMPPVLLRNDNLANWAAAIWLGSRDPHRARIALQAAPGDYFKVNFWEGPKAYFEALAFAMEGRHDAARAKWEDALHAVDKRLVEEPTRPTLLFLRADILGRLGRRSEAEQVARTFRQLTEDDQPTWLNLHLLVAIGQSDDAIALLETWSRAGRLAPVQRTSLRLDPRFDSLRGNARFEALLSKR